MARRVARRVGGGGITFRMRRGRGHWEEVGEGRRRRCGQRATAARRACGGGRFAAHHPQIPAAAIVAAARMRSGDCWLLLAGAGFGRSFAAWAVDPAAFRRWCVELVLVEFRLPRATRCRRRPLLVRNGPCSTSSPGWLRPRRERAGSPRQSDRVVEPPHGCGPKSTAASPRLLQRPLPAARQRRTTAAVHRDCPRAPRPSTRARRVDHVRSKSYTCEHGARA